MRFKKFTIYPLFLEVLKEVVQIISLLIGQLKFFASFPDLRWAMAVAERHRP